MYKQCLNRLGDIESGCALVAHHENDADENRIAELGKGNIVHINGCLTWALYLVSTWFDRCSQWGNRILSTSLNALAFATCRTPRPNGVIAVSYGGLLAKLQLKMSRIMCLFCLNSLERGLLFIRLAMPWTCRSKISWLNGFDGRLSTQVHRAVKLLTHALVLLGETSWDVLRAPSGQAAAPGLLSECRGRSHRSLVVSLLFPNSS